MYHIDLGYIPITIATNEDLCASWQLQRLPILREK